MLSAFIPIWLLTGLGYLAARFNLVGAVSADVEAVLGRFVFRVAMPASLFGMLARSDLHALANTSIVAFGVSSLAACGLGLVISTRVFGRDVSNGAVVAMASGYVNSANLGIPVAIQVLGNAAFLSTVILFNTVLVTPILMTLMGLGDGPSPGIRHRLRGIALLPVHNPIIIASAFGALVSGTHFHVPADVSSALTLLGGAAVPVALITLGMSLYGGSGKGTAKDGSRDASRHTSNDAYTSAENSSIASENLNPEQRIEKSRIAEAAIALTLKIALQPVLAYLLARYALDLSGRDVLAVTLCAALPTAQNVFIYASEYALDTVFARNAVIFSTVTSMAGLWTVVALLK
ncbi:Auxin Efflux Carrier [Catenulispora acidiphila DSM 44928]|uniref:Auxin Efflux Carrier n=1 Tax=Catenulispora acidiphila (strain DSM 44928 / JCM 14897 / NBRC 102108 / NRRL B-24433 / ID139908) TaxID=479433 RepID=C7QE95_CATAD|nr:AEC family transporter [Catenulispora acidiphila]ACU70786.1 Auxin Efflux Carrier [Catenulispora acidiphila DSM 44928]